MIKTEKNRGYIEIFISGLLILMCFTAITLISGMFTQTVPEMRKPVLQFVILLITASLIYLFAVDNAVNKKRSTARLVILILTAGVLVRLITVFSVPVLEDDHYRYMWDGAVVSHGISPYKYPPQDILTGKTGISTLERLAAESGDITENINHPHLSTIYPPVTQIFFALSHIIHPWDITTFRLLLLAVDMINFGLLLILLRSFNLPLSYTIIYWWNPVLIVTTFNAAHFDIISLPFVLLSVLFLLKNKITGSAMSLAAAAGTKLWPVLLLPVMTSVLFRNRIRFLKYASIFAAATAVISLPVLIAGIDRTSGFIAYGTSWENNSSLFRIFLGMFEVVFETAGIHPGHAQLYTRVFVILLVGSISLWLFIRNNTLSDIPKAMLIITGAAFLLSPTQFPWYYIWVLPFLTLQPRWSLLAATALLPLYYTFYYLEPRGMRWVFEQIIVFIEFAPVWLLLVAEWRWGSFFAFRK